MDYSSSPLGCARQNHPMQLTFGVLSVWWKTSVSRSVLFWAVLPHRSCRCQQGWLHVVALRIATGRVRIGWSLRAPKTETQNQNPNPPRKPIRVEIHQQNQTRGYPKPEQIPETRMDTRNPRIYIHIFTCINKRQQIINIFMSQL